MPIEQAAPELERILSLDQEIEELGTGYQTAEGPLWHREGGYLLFSDIRGNRRMKWAPQVGMSVDHEPSNNANGLTRDLQGRLIACESGLRRMARIDAGGVTTVVAGRYQGREINRPNDVVVKSDGSIYFTDPGALDHDLDLDFSGVYRVTPDLGSITLLARDFILPNGLAFSPDESVLYVDDSRKRHIRAFDLQPNGAVAPATDRVFFQFTGDRPGLADGMKVDVEGNIYCAGPGGIWIIDASGKHLGTILTGSEQTTNCAWGGGDWKTLYITTRERVGRITCKISGIPVPR